MTDILISDDVESTDTAALERLQRHPCALVINDIRNGPAGRHETANAAISAGATHGH